MARISLDTTSDTRGAKRFNEEIAKGEKELEGLTKAARGFAGQKRKFEEMADPLKKLNREWAQLALSHKKHGLSLEDAEKAAAKLQRRHDRLADSGRSAFGARAIGQITQYASGFLSVSAAAGAFLSILQRIRQEQQAAADAARAGVPAQAKLVQLAGGDPKKRATLDAAADKIYSEGFVASREQARSLTFELESAGRMQDRAFFSSLALIDDAPALAKSAGLISAGFSGGDAVGTSQQIISKAIAGALPATGVSPADIAEGVALSAASAKGFGFRDEELTAAVSRVSQTTGSGSEAGTRVRRLFAALTRQGMADKMQGQSLSSVMGGIEAMGLSQAELTKYLGSVEAVQAYDVLRDQGAYGQRLQEIESAQSSGLAMQTIRNALADGSIRAGVFSRAGEAAKVLSQDDQADQLNRAQGFRNMVEANMRNEGWSEMGIGGWRWMEEWREWSGSPRDINAEYGIGSNEEVAHLLREQNAMMREQGKPAGRQE